jgi:hypothetical protein
MQAWEAARVARHVAAYLTLILAVVAVIGVYTARSSPAPPPRRALGALPRRDNAVPIGSSLVIPVGYYFGTYVLHAWVKKYRDPFRLRVDTGSTDLLFGGLPGCAQPPDPVCTIRGNVDAAGRQLTFGAGMATTARDSTLAAGTLTFGFVDGAPLTLPGPVDCLVGNGDRTFVFPLNIGAGGTGLMAALGVRRFEMTLTSSAWDLRRPSQLVLQPDTVLDQSRVLLRTPLVPVPLLRQLFRGVPEPPRYVFRVRPPAAVARQSIRYALVDVGSATSYVPVQPGLDRITESLTFDLVDTDAAITLAASNTVPLSRLVAAAASEEVRSQVVVIGTAALNDVAFGVDLDHGPTGALMLLTP